MREWTEDRLGRLASIQIGGTPARDKEEYWARPEDDGFPWVAIADLGPRLVVDTRERITSLGANNSNVKLVQSGALLMSFKLTIGRVGVAGRDLYTNEAIASIVPIDGRVDGRLLYYLLPSAAQSAVSDAAIKGATLNSKKLRELVVRFPARIEEQGRIAVVLATIDDAIEQTEALIAKAQQIKAGLMHDLFTRGVTPDGRLRPSREEAPEFYKQSRLGWIPREWEAGSLAQMRSASRPHLKTGPFGSSLKLEHWVEEGRPVITIGALGEGEFIRTELLYVSEETARGLREYQMEVGDVVFSRVADVGRSVTICSEEQGWIMSSNLMRISLDRELVAPAFLQAELAYDARVRRQIRATVNAGGRDVANSETLNRLAFPWPPRGEQERIVDRLEGLEGVRRSNVEQLEKLKLERTGLMHDLLTGRVRVPTAAVP
jgi:type I restriction enzyme S subunit